MTSATPFANVSAAALPVAWRAQPRVEKARFSNALDGEQPEDQQRDDAFAKQSHPSKPSQIVTVDAPQAWMERRLVPGFVAQLISQVIEDSPDRRSALAAYRGREASFAALLLDRSL